MDSIDTSDPGPGHDSVDVAIVGAGPIGIELAIALKTAGIHYVHFDAAQVGHTLTWWPRNTEFFSTTERLALAGVPIQLVDQGRITGEAYLAYLRSLVEQFDLDVRTFEPVIDLRRDGAEFVLRTRRHGGERICRATRVVLATGDMAEAQRLEVPGEDLPTVTHYFTDPHQYFRTRLLVVGGKNSAVEAALRCWRAGAAVTLSYRRDAFDADRIKAHLLPDLEAQVEAGNIQFLPRTAPVGFREGAAMLAATDAGGAPTGETQEIAVDFVYLATGFRADMTLFRQAGVPLMGQSHAPAYDEATMETPLPGLYVAGTAAAGTQSRYTLFIENSHVHVGRIVEHITGAWPDRLGTIAHRSYPLPMAKIQAN